MSTYARRLQLRGRPAPGLSLIELMIALLLGMVVTGAAAALFITNRQTFATSESLARVQENARTAFELMARDVREAGGNPCGIRLQNAVNVINPSTSFFTDFSSGVRGYNGSTAFPGSSFGTGAGQRASGTDAIELKSFFTDGVTVATHTPTSAQFKVNTVNHGLQEGDISLVCDGNHAAIFQVTNSQPGTNVTVVHSSNNSQNQTSPGNCTKGLGAPLSCSTNGNPYEFGCAYGGLNPSVDCTTERWTAMIAKLKATRWYIGHNGRGGRSLYQASVFNNGGVVSIAANEIAEGVENMTLEFLRENAAAYQAPGAITNWSDVRAVRINLRLVGQGNVGTDGGTLVRELEHVIAIRNGTP